MSRLRSYIPGKTISARVFLWQSGLPNHVVNSVTWNFKWKLRLYNNCVAIPPALCTAATFYFVEKSRQVEYNNLWLVFLIYVKVCKKVCKNAAPIFQHEVLNYRFCNYNSLLLLLSCFLLWTAAHLIFNLRHLSMFRLKVHWPSHHHRKAVQLMMKSTNQLLNTLGSPAVFSWGGFMPQHS